MESSSLPGRVQCTQETAALIQMLQPAIEVEPRGTMDIKGRGQLETFFLNGPLHGCSFRALRPGGVRSKKTPTRHSMGDIQIGEEESSKLSQLYESGSAGVARRNSGGDDEEQGLSKPTAIAE